ncbi:hypothetical protein M409DRAFT_66182 [Zasmidium cellare ATCC 36951]|uniref:NAD(P)-binding protein n=1 Tax=Zasmidium cellare ATCC 36951 TaxID=1080233 RepID=A0A6A6CJA5_ZASCE|nr:uncharacterized protein M409DRAFT_66182 [Zasmidium cellare ATCC 36951]KAF2167121.1 hypothetical protein M409DRAFT_66182 [Zasmidium cellare ATCC 36951]
MPLDIEGKTALVTGAGSGICLAFAQQLLQKRCNVVIADLVLQPDAEETINKHSSGKPRAVFIKTDVTDWTQLQTVFDKTIDEFGSLDIVCPGAGIFEPPSSTFWNYPSPVDTAVASSYKTLDINLQSPIRCTQLAIDAFARQGHKHGVVVHISSSAAQVAASPVPLYATMGVKVVAVAPGTTQTPLWDASGRRGYVDEEKGDEYMQPGEIAGWMIRMVTEEEYGGGTILEIAREKSRRVELLNDPGPDMTAKGLRMSNLDLGMKQMMEGIEKSFGK